LLGEDWGLPSPEDDPSQEAVALQLRALLAQAVRDLCAAGLLVRRWGGAVAGGGGGGAGGGAMRRAEMLIPTALSRVVRRQAAGRAVTVRLCLCGS
jgi:hypothetical protein